MEVFAIESMAVSAMVSAMESDPANFRTATGTRFATTGRASVMIYATIGKTTATTYAMTGKIGMMTFTPGTVAGMGATRRAIGAGGITFGTIIPWQQRLV